jgi:hypothetical protein
MTNGMKTSEFLVCISVIVLGVLMQSGVLTDSGTVAKICGTAMEILAALGYTWSRATIKLGPKSEKPI